MARFYAVNSRGEKYLVDIDEIQAFQGGTKELRIIMKHEFDGLWADREDVIRIMNALGISQDEIAKILK